MDNGLNPRIADLLSQLEYSMRSVQAEFGVAPTDSLSDEEIIRHIGNTYGHRGVWVTKDTSSKREHAGNNQSKWDFGHMDKAADNSTMS